MPAPVAFIAAISSDIGQAMAQIYRARGWHVVGTYRDRAAVARFTEDDGVELLACDLDSPEQIDAVARYLQQKGIGWDLFISAIGMLAPIGPFFTLDRHQWLRSVAANGTAQLALLHAIFPFRRATPLARAAFLVGGALNRGFPNYSAYSLGKLNLVKFCELIHEECPDLHAVAVGTGWVATRIHQQTLAAGNLAGGNLARTEEFLAAPGGGTSVSDIVACLDWCFAQDRALTGGRNFSVVHDPWRQGGADLAQALRHDDAKFKLRRHADMT
jgi:NAD(P)-dependent dehydrogenase (short-subunit alcohol dehydrogenase family)